MPALDYGDGLVYITADDLANHLNVPAVTLRRWATQDDWQSKKIHGRRYYLLIAAQRSYRDRGRAHRDTRKRTLDT